MKITLYILIFFNLSFCFSQAVVQKYNSLLNRYEFFNEYGDMLAYKTYNSLLNQWEIYSINQKNQKTDNEKYIQPINLELLASVMAQKQARYDNLTLEEKRRLNQQQEYRNYLTRKNQVTNEFFKIYNKSEKTNSEILKNGIKNLKDNDDKDLMDISTFSDGWYVCFFITEFQSKISETPKAVNYKRYFQILNGKVINYIGNNNIIYPVINMKSSSSSSFLDLTIESKLGIQVDVLIYAVSDKPLKKVPEFFNGISKIFYTTVQEGGKIDIFIKHNNNYTYLGKINEYWKDETILNCNIENGVINVILPPGEYKYFAFGDTMIWEGEFSLNENDYCHKTKLISN